MKTLQELYNELIASDELKTAFAEAAKDGKAQEFLKAHGCEATMEELTAFLKGRTGELCDEELDQVAGGGCDEDLAVGIVVSICSGIGGTGYECIAETIVSVTTDVARDC